MYLNCKLIESEHSIILIYQVYNNIIDMDSSYKDNYQKKFFDILSKRNTKDHKIVYDLMDLLDIKKGAAYKRMNGDTNMSISEIIKVSDHYNLSMDAIFRSDKFISFFHPFVHKEKASLDVFIDQYKKFFKPCLLYTSPSPRDATLSRMPSSA